MVRTCNASSCSSRAPRPRRCSLSPALTSPNAFDLDVGKAQRVDTIYAAAMGIAVVMGGLQDFPDQGIRCFLIIDPNGIAITCHGAVGTGSTQHRVGELGQLATAHWLVGIEVCGVGTGRRHFGVPMIARVRTNVATISGSPVV
jgi:hypothetical protein